MQEAAILAYNATLKPCEEGFVSSKLSGKVVEVMVENGQMVAKGKALVMLDDQDIRNNIKSAQQQLTVNQSQLKATQNQLIAIQASLQKLELNVENAQRIYDQAKAMYEQGAGAKTDMDSAENALKATNAELASGKISVQTARIAAETAQGNVNVAKVSVSNYTHSLNNTMSQLKEGMTAQLKFNGAEESYTGTLRSVGVSADESSRTFTCKIAVANDKQSLHPGDFVTVNLISDAIVDTINIPLRALIGGEGDYSVFVMDNSVAKKVRVTIGKISDDRAGITSGLVKGQSVIITNLNVLQDGDTVTVSDEGK